MNHDETANKLTARAYMMIAEARMKFMASCAAENIDIVFAMFAWDMGVLAIGLDTTNKTYMILGNLLRGISMDETLANSMSGTDRENATKAFQEMIWLWKQDPEHQKGESG